MLKFFTTLKKDQVDSLALGGFDGVHKAHQEILSNLSKNGLMLSIYKDTRGLTPKEYRCKFAPRGCVLIELEDIKSMSAKEFIDFLCKEFPNLKKIVVGYDFHFGRGREADAKTIKRYFRGEVIIVDEIKIDGISIHSKKIKALLDEGDIELANRLLGRSYKIEADVIKGQGIGSKKLFPTLNLECKDFIIPKHGVYATNSVVDLKSYPSVTFIGIRSSTDGAFSIETHLLDTDITVDSKRVEVEFIKYIRENRKFDDLDSLKLQIQKDIKIAKSLLL